MPDILVNVRKSGDDAGVGVIREVLPVMFSCGLFGSFCCTLLLYKVSNMRFGVTKFLELV